MDDEANVVEERTGVAEPAKAEERPSETPESPTETKTETERQASGRKKIRYAVVGLGYISQVAVLPGFAHATENSELVALVSGDADKLKPLARKYKVRQTYTYEQYAECLESGNIDAVYIALPNNMHRAYAEGAARAGVHVLCEKPMAMTEHECEGMIEAAKQGKVKLMIAYRLHFERGNLSAIEAIRQEKIGDPRIFNSVFCQQVTPGNTRLQSELGGGPLFDVGVYCINAARYLFGAEPYEAFAFSARRRDEQDDRFREVPEMTSAILRYPDERLAQFVCSFGAADRSEYEVVGTKGSLRMDPAYEMVGDLKCEITVDGKTKKTTYKKRDQFGPELAYFSKCILENIEPEPNGLEGLADVRIINALLESADRGKPVEIKPIENKQRPTVEQELHKPAVEKPPLVRAQTPSQ
jgi:predicted dehydrogenase